jgi:hypothetical protein
MKRSLFFLCTDMRINNVGFECILAQETLFLTAATFFMADFVDWKKD